MAPDAPAPDAPAPADPWIISVDDHVTEPPDLWTSRLPSRFKDRAPRVDRHRARMRFEGVTPIIEQDVPDAGWVDFWVYDDVARSPLMAVTHAVSFDEEGLQAAYVENRMMTYDDIAPGCWQQGARLDAMSQNHIDASLCFPNGVPGFCGRTFAVGDLELGLLSIQAYNDWMIDEWTAGAGTGRLIPLTLVPLWDAELAAAEVRRCAAKGSHAVSFCESPAAIGLPSFYDPSNFWDPFFAACQETETVVNMHIGSSGGNPTTSADAPYTITSVLMFQNSVHSLLDVIFSGLLERFPQLKFAYSEGQIGWLPYVITRADKTWADPHDGGVGIRIPRPPSSYVPGHIYGCIFDDDIALSARDEIGIGQIMWEVDYPHGATSFPNTFALAHQMCAAAGLTDDERSLVFRGNAIEAFGLQRFGITV